MMAGYQGGNARSLVDTSAVDGLGDFAFRTLMSLQDRQMQDEKFNLERQAMAQQMRIADAEYAQRAQEEETRQAAAEAKAQKARQDKLMTLADKANTPDEFKAIVAYTLPDATPQEIEAGSALTELSTKRRKEEKEAAQFHAMFTSQGGADPKLASFATPEEQKEYMKAVKKENYQGVLAFRSLWAGRADAHEQRQARELVDARAGAQRENARYAASLRPAPTTTNVDIQAEDAALIEAGNGASIVAARHKGRAFKDPIISNLLREGTVAGTSKTKADQTAGTLTSLAQVQGLALIASELDVGGLGAEQIVNWARKGGISRDAVANELNATLDLLGLSTVFKFSGAAFTDDQWNRIKSIIVQMSELRKGSMDERSGAARARFRGLYKSFKTDYLNGIDPNLKKQVGSKLDDWFEGQFQDSAATARELYQPAEADPTAAPAPWDDDY